MSFYTSGVCGFRAWRIGMGECRLQGRFAAPRWKPNGDPTTAECSPPFSGSELKRNHESPHMECRCGLYAYKDMEQLLAHIPMGVQTAFGAVYAWGRLVEHEYGFRAQYAKPICIVERTYNSHYSWDWLYSQISDVYGIPIVSVDEIGNFAEEFAPTMDQLVKPC